MILAEAVKEVAADPPPEVDADPIVRPGRRLCWPETAIDCDALAELFAARARGCRQRRANPSAARWNVLLNFVLTGVGGKIVRNFNHS
jgi:hypothetical protein